MDVSKWEIKLGNDQTTAALPFLLLPFFSSRSTQHGVQSVLAVN